MPADGPSRRAVSVAVQVLPASEVVKTRGESTPPVTKANDLREIATMQVPLAAKANSPCSALGIPAVDCRCHDLPKLSDTASRKCPFTGSLRASP